MAETLVEQRKEQTTARVTVTRGGRSPKVEVTVESICDVGDEKKLIGNIISTIRELLKELSYGRLDYDDEEF